MINLPTTFNFYKDEKKYPSASNKLIFDSITKNKQSKERLIKIEIIVDFVLIIKKSEYMLKNFKKRTKINKRNIIINGKIFKWDKKSEAQKKLKHKLI